MSPKNIGENFDVFLLSNSEVMKPERINDYANFRVFSNTLDAVVNLTI